MFQTRYDAAEQLLPFLEKYKNNPDALLLAIPRGGLELGYILAKGLHLPLDVIFTKKIGFPLNPEYAIGAVSEKHAFVENKFNTPELQHYIVHEIEVIRKIIKERNETYRKGMPPFSLKDKDVIIVDDGVATGNTLLITIKLIKEYGPKKIIVALPVASKEALQKVKEHADDVICLLVPEIFYGVGQFYMNFHQVDDDQAIALLHEANS